jgi:hypothetical protein
MSSSLERLVPVLDGTNYRRWVQDMQAYLQTQELWEVMTNDYPFPTEPQGRTTGTGAQAVTTPPDPDLMVTYREELRKWRRKNNAAAGAISLRIHPNLRHHCNTVASTTWRNLRDAYAGQSMPAIFADFKQIIQTRLSGGNPIPEIEHLATLFGRMASNNTAIAAQMQAMILLAALPQKWDSVAQLFLQRADLTDHLTFANVSTAIIREYERKVRPVDQSANKLSAVKRKGQDPSHRQQQPGPSSQQQQGGPPKGKKRGGKQERAKRASSSSSKTITATRTC